MPPKTNKQREKLEQSQASSRAKAHESLRGAGGFVGFSSFAKPPADAPANPFAAFATASVTATGDDYSSGGSAAASAIYDGADHDIAMALKMLGKKGTVTKIKALQTFLTDLLPHKKPVELRGMVGHFVQLYTFEVRDQKDRKVRQLLNDALLALASKLKPKAFAPHLRRLLPYWLMAMHDPNPEAATAATKALDALFPDNIEMQAEVVVAHLSAIMEEYSAFFQHSPETFPGVTLPEADEREERYERCVTAAVLSIDKILRLLTSTNHIDKLSDETDAFSVASVVSHDKFGRLVSATSKNANFTRDAIRQATYKTLKTLVTTAFAIVEAREEYFGKLVLGALSDKHPANQHDLWDMVLTFLQTATPALWASPSFGKFVKSAVQPRLFAQVRHGFYGSARSSFPVLLPLLSMLPLEHVVDFKSGMCPLYTGVVENATKFLVSSEGRFYEDITIQSTFECIRAFLEFFLRSPTNRTAALRLFEVSDANDVPSERVVEAYVNQFEKPTRDSLLTALTSTKLSVRNVKTYATEWHTMITKLSSATDAVSSVVAERFVAASNAWLLSVLETLPAAAAVQPSHVHTFLNIVGTKELLATAGNRMYEACLVQLTTPERATAALELMNGLYDVVGADALGIAASAEEHFAQHVRPLVMVTGATASERLGSNDVAVVLRAVRQFFTLVDDKKAFVLQLFQDFGVQYGDLLKAARVVETCFEYSFSSAGAAQWVTSGSFSDLPQATAPAHALEAVWKGKLLDEFVMISLKGRLDDADAVAFSTLLHTCIGADANMPVVSADAVVILSHFVTQQQHDDDVVMRILPSLITLFTKLGDVALPSELQAAEEQLYLCLLHLAAKSSFTTEAAALWKRHVRAAVFKWTSERRLSLIDSLAATINAIFAADGAAYSAKIWASYVELYAELACTEDEDAACTAFALINRLTLFDLRFEGSRSQLTTLYDRLLSCLAELCDADDAGTKRVTSYFTELLAQDRDRGLKLLRRIVDIDVCHGLTWAILQSESMAALRHDAPALPLEYVSLRPLYASLADYVPSVLEILSDDASPRYRRVLFTNQHPEAGAVNDDVDALEDLSTEQHARLDRYVVNVLVSFLTSAAAAAYAETWLEQPRSLNAMVSIDRIVRVLAVSEDATASDVLGRVISKSVSMLPQWPSPTGVDALKVVTTVWRMDHTTSAFDAGVHHPVLLKLSRAFAMTSQSSAAEWIDAAAYLAAVPSAWTESETLDDSKKRWSLAARGLLTHALSGKPEMAAVATLGIHKRTLPPSLEDSEGEHARAAIAAYPLALVRCRRVTAELIQVMTTVDNGESLRELAPQHLEDVVSTLLYGMAEGLLLKTHLVPTYLDVASASQSLAIIDLAADVDALLDAVTLTLPTVLPLLPTRDRLRVLLLDAFVHIKGLAACFNLEKSTTPLHVRALLYTICTTTGVFQPSAGADATAGVDINADDEAAAEAALAKSIIPAGLRAGLKAAFQVSTASANRSKRSRRKQHTRPEEDDELVAKLLVWDLFIQLFPDSGSRDGGYLGMRSSALCAYVAKNGLLSTYLTLCGELLSRETGSQSEIARLKLQDAPLYELEALDSDVTTVALAARSFFRTVLRLPAMVRTWWNDECSRSLRSWATKYFEEHITPYVLASELDIILKASESHSWDTDEMTVKGSKVSREITTTYLKDECALEMVIRVPSAYPLRSVEVECTRRIGMTEDRWRRWVLQIIKVTSAQDGSLLDAVLLWKQNLDKEFEGVEPCPICYSILNPKTMGLPNLSCKTCSNKYHNSCLYKWFNQSGKNKCPICQQPFT